MKRLIYKAYSCAYLCFKKITCRKECTLDGVKIPLKHPGITVGIRNSIFLGGYEKSEREFLKKVLRRGDKFLEIGCGLGVVTTLASKILNNDSSIMTWEALPETIKMADMTFELNEVNISINQGAVVGDDTPFIEMNTWAPFWSSSIFSREIDSSKQEKVRVKTKRLSVILEEFQPDVCLIDVEGAEINYVADLSLSPPKFLILETHKKVVGESKNLKLLNDLENIGYVVDSKCKDVYLFELKN